MQFSLDDWVAGGQYVLVSGHNVFYRQDGPIDGHPVTLIHGYPTSSHDWAKIVPALTEAGHRVTTLDMLGFGASDKPRGHRYRLGEQASIVEAVWRELGIADTALVVHDYGVSVAQELLARAPQRITRTVWLNGGVYPDLHRALLIQKLLRSPVGRLLSRVTTERSFRASLRSTLGRSISDDAQHDMWRAASGNGGRQVLRPLIGYIDERKVNGQRWIGALESFSGPVLFVWGPADPVSGAHVLPRLRERLPNAHIVVLDEEPATGHYPQVENPAGVIDAIVPFLAR